MEKKTEQAQLEELILLEALAEKKAKIYSRLLMDPHLAKKMEGLSLRHAERKESLEKLLYGKPLDKKSKQNG